MTTDAPKSNTSTALTSTPHPDQAVLARVLGTTRDPAAIGRMLDEAARHLHLVSPATSVGTIPEGFAVVTSVVKVDPERDTYAIAGSSDRGLSKIALDRIALAAGVSADSRQSRRLDDGRDPRYCHYRWVGTYRTFDGSTIEIAGEKILDMRDKSPAVEALWSKYREKLADWERGGKQGAPPKSPESSIREIRSHLLSLCSSKARNRALRTGLGLRTSYSRAELAKPYVVAKIAFTGQTEDPALRREFAMQMMQAHFAAGEKLYGRGAQPYRQLSAGEPAPPVGSVVDHDEDGVVEGEWDPSPPRAPAPAAAAPADPRYSQTVSRQEPRPAPAPGGDDAPPAGFFDEDDHDAAEPEPAPAGQRSGLVIPGGRAKGTPIEDAEERDLTYWAGRIEGDLAEGKTREAFVDRDNKLAQAMRDELARRGA